MGTKISALPNRATVQDTDLLVVADSDEGTNYKTSVSEFIAGKGIITIDTIDDNNIVTSTTNPLTAGLGLSTGVAGYVLGAKGFIPATADDAGILAAFNAAVDNGGGVIQLAPITYTITTPMPIADNIQYVGSGYTGPFQGSSDAIGGTVLQGNITINCFEAKHTGTNPAIDDAEFLTNFGASDLLIKDFKRGFHIGSAGQRGLLKGVIEKLAIYNCLEWACWFENTEACDFNRIYYTKCGNGFFLGNSITSTNLGDSMMRNIGGDMSASGYSSRTSRGVVLCAHYGSLNSMSVHNCGTNGAYASTVYNFTGTWTNGSSVIAVANTQYLAVGLPVLATTVSNPGGLTTLKTYFIKSLVPNTSIELSLYDWTDLTTNVNGKTAIVLTGAGGSITFGTKGFAGLSAYTANSDNKAITGCHFHDCNSENGGTGQLFLQGAVYCTFTNAEPNSISAGGNFNVISYYAALIRNCVLIRYDVVRGAHIDSDSQFLSECSYDTAGTNKYSGNLFTGIGVKYNQTTSYRGMLTLDGNYAAPTINTDNLGAYQRFGVSMAWTDVDVANGATLTYSTQANCYTYVTAGAGNITLPGLGSYQNGFMMMISNPQNFALTVTPNTTQKIIGDGAVITGPAVLTIPAYTNVILIVHKNGSEYYWAKY